MSRLTNYNGTEAANLALGQAGVDLISGGTAVHTPGGSSKRWVSILIIGDGSGTLTLTPEVGDAVTLTAGEQADNLGVAISGPWSSVTASNTGCKLVCYRG